MLRILVNILLIVAVVRLFQALVRGVGRSLGQKSSPHTPPRGSNGAKPPISYDELTPYDIEDGDYEEIEKD